jgi:hypothetical protein
VGETTVGLFPVPEMIPGVAFITYLFKRDEKTTKEKRQNLLQLFVPRVWTNVVDDSLSKPPSACQNKNNITTTLTTNKRPF